MMKKLLPLIAFSLFISVTPNLGYSQACNNTMLGGQSGCARSNFYYGEILPSLGCGTYTSVAPYSPGEYFRIPVLQGACYTISTCGAPFDTQINCFQGNNTTGPFAYDDDSGPECAGLAASCVMVPGFTDYARIDVRQYPCQPGGSSSITVSVRQNNNLSFTSSGADMCEGEVRALTAIPAAVVGGLPGSGDMGTFTGTGVSGTNFTAPTPAAASQVYMLTYSFGYCSTTQNITVWHTPTASNAGSNFNAACDATSAVLSANTPTYGTGTWSLISGTGSFGNVNDPNTTVTGLTPGASSTFRWTITNGPCTASQSDVTVTVPVSPVPTATNTGPYCEGATIQLNSPSGSATDDWAGPNSYVQADMQNPTIGSSTTMMSGAYTVTVTDVNGCTGTATTSVVVNANPTPTATNTGPYCEGATIQLNSPSGSATDDWAGPNSYVQADMQNPTIGSSTTTMSGAYTVTVTDGNGCSATATTTVLVDAYPTPTATNTGPYCEGATIQLNSPSGSATDDWAGPNSYVQADMQNPTIGTATTLMSGDYTVTVTNATGCSATATTTVVVNTNPTPTATNTGPYCEGATIQLNSPSGSATDDWAGPNSYVQNDMQNPTIGSSTTLMSGDYTVTVTDGNGCSGTATTTVVVNANPTPTATNTGPYCVGDTIQLESPTGSATDDWAGPNSYVQNDTQNPTIPSATLTMAGNYTVTVTNGTGCSATATTLVVVNNVPSPTASNTGPYCEGQTIQLNSNGLATDDWAGPNSFTATDTQNPTIINSTIAMNGVYTVTVTNGAGCSATATTTVSVLDCSGVEDQELGVVVLYPNPTTGKISVSITNDLTGWMSLYLFDMNGKVIYQTKFEKGNENLIREIDITEEKAGMYILNILFEGGKRFTDRIVKH